MDSLNIPITTAATLAGVSRRRVDQLVTEGQLIRAKAGVVTVASLAAYLASQRTHAGSTTELEAERVLLVRAQRKLVDQRRRRAAGKLIEAATAHAFVSQLVIITRNAFMNCGSVLAPLCARAADQHEIRRLIDDELREICEQLARQGDGLPEDEAPPDDDADDIDPDTTTSD